MDARFDGMSEAELRDFIAHRKRQRATLSLELADIRERSAKNALDIESATIALISVLNARLEGLTK